MKPPRIPHKPLHVETQTYEDGGCTTTVSLFEPLMRQATRINRKNSDGPVEFWRNQETEPFAVLSRESADAFWEWLMGQ